MHEPDTANWRDIANGVRPVTWSDFVGSVEGATYLSAAGRELLPRMVDGFESWFGGDWLRQALDTGGKRNIVSLARFAPPMTVVGAEHGVAGAFLELVRWWAAIETQRQKPGVAQVRTDLRHDVTITRLLHTLTQLRLGAIATQVGMTVIYEPSPGDLQLGDGTDSVTVEVFAMRTPRDLDNKTRTTDDMFRLLDELAREYGVSFHGNMPELGSNIGPWADRVRDVAAQASRLGIALSIRWAELELTVEPGDATEGTTLTGPTIELDVGSRLRRRVRDKANQVAGARSSWLWLENHGAVDMLVPVHGLPLAEQLAAYRELLAGALDEVPSAKGITVSAAGQRQWPPSALSRVGDEPFSATRQPLPLDRVRTTLHLPTADCPESRLMRALVDHEPLWLDLALSQLGVAATALELLRPDLRPR